MHEFTLALSDSKETPLYEQLVRYVTDEVKAGRLIQGERLPSKRALCVHLGVSRNTVETAYQILAAEGYIEGRPRSGYYVCAYEVPVGTPKSQPDAARAQEPPELEFKFRFSTADVDTSIFPYSAWARLYRQVVQSGAGLLSRGHPQGDAELRAALSEFLHQYRGVSCDPDQIVIGAGVEYLLGLLPPLLPGAVFALEDPGYGAVYRALAGGAHVPIALDEGGMSMDALIQSPASVAYVTPSHQFPTGVTMPAGRRAKLIDWANQAAGRYIVEDDYDSEFRHLTRPIPAMQGMDQARVIYIGTFNRSIAPSIRVAYLVLPVELCEIFRRRFSGVSVTVSRFEQQALSRFISEGHYARHLRRMSGLYKRRRDLLVEQLCAIEGVSLSGDEAGLHFLLRHDRLTEVQLVERAAAQGVMVHGLSEYAFAYPCAPNTVVLGYGGLGEVGVGEATRRIRQAWT